MNDSGGIGILGVIVGVVLVVGLIYLAFGERLGMRSAGGGNTTIKVEAPRVPENK